MKEIPVCRGIREWTAGLYFFGPILTMIFLERPDDFKERFEITSCFVEYAGRILLLLRQGHKSEPNTYWVPAGKVEANEDIMTATIRETKEETWLVMIKTRIHFYKSVFVRYPDYDFVYHIHHSELTTKPIIQLNPEEHKGFLWVTPEESLQRSDLIGWLDDCIRLFYKIPTSISKD